VGTEAGVDEDPGVEVGDGIAGDGMAGDGRVKDRRFAC